jgi:hypothetical protein
MVLAGLADVGQAVQVQYGVYVSSVSVTILGASYSCTSVSDPNCAFVTVVANGDTSTITPFSVPGASGYKNSVGPASVSVGLNSGVHLSDTLLPGQIFVSVDQTNGGAGFGSSFSPTYPAATYGGSADYAHYALDTDFYAQGFSGFCPVLSVCSDGAPLHTVSGSDFLITFPFRPNFSVFSSTVTPIPEPATAALMLVGLGALAVRLRLARCG